MAAGFVGHDLPFGNGIEAYGTGGIIFSIDPVCVETECAAVTGGDVCRFTARLEPVAAS